MRIIVHRGTHEIGGNCVEIEQDGARIVLDVGKPLETTRQLIRPDVPGLFERGPRIEGVILSHAHGDHAGWIGEIRPKIPVWLTRETSKMLAAASIYGGQRSLHIPPEQECYLYNEEKTRIGSFEVQAVNVDHSGYGSVATIISAGGSRVLYSGDLRAHGPHPCRLERLVALANRAGPIDLLIMEGTRINQPERPGPQTESELLALCKERMLETNGIVWLAFSPLNVDRFRTLLHATWKAGRTFVTDPYGLFVLHLVRRDAGCSTPFDRSKIRLLTNGRQSLAPFHRYQPLIQKQIVTLEDIRNTPSKFACVLRSHLHPFILEGPCPADDALIFGYWPGYMEDAAMQLFRSKAQAAGIRWHNLHVSGHISHRHMEAFVNSVAAKALLPIHTTQPEAFRLLHPNAINGSDGAAITI